MSNDEYKVLTNKALEAEQKVKDAFKQFDKELKEAVKDVSRSDMLDWFERAEKDDSISSGLFNQMCDVYTATHMPEDLMGLLHILAILR